MTIVIVIVDVACSYTWEIFWSSLGVVVAATVIRHRHQCWWLMWLLVAKYVGR